MLTDIQTPTIALHGTAREALIEQRTNVANKLREVLDAMREAAPNGRDFNPKSMSAAVAIHTERRRTIEQMVEAYTDEAMAIDDACPNCGGTEHADPLPGTVGRRCVRCCGVTN